MFYSPHHKILSHPPKGKRERETECVETVVFCSNQVIRIAAKAKLVDKQPPSNNIKQIIMSVSNTSEIPTLAGSYITLDTIKTPGDVTTRRTKIICTIGPACWNVDQLETLMDCGMDVARFNFSHGTHSGHGAVLERLRQAAKNKERNIGTLQWGCLVVLFLLLTSNPSVSVFFWSPSSSSTRSKNVTIIHTSLFLPFPLLMR